MTNGAATGVSGTVLAEDDAVRGAKTNRDPVGEFSLQAGAVIGRWEATTANDHWVAEADRRVEGLRAGQLSYSGAAAFWARLFRDGTLSNTHYFADLFNLNS
ncbi:MAG: hypothetical protein AAF570_19850, partial [Bacteroidota bacterium]